MITTADPLDLDALRIRHEFLSLPGLRASVDMVASMVGVNTRHARQLLDALVAEHFLTRTPDGQYVRDSGATS
jgi:hypothetical protein